MKKLFLIASIGFLWIGFKSQIHAQIENVLEQPTLINTTSTSIAAPHSSAALEVTSNSQGILIPRMAQINRNAITNPATGLLVFQVDSPQGYYFYDGASWSLLDDKSTLSDLDLDTRIQVEESPDEDRIRFDIGGVERMRLQDDHLRMNGDLYFASTVSGNPGDKISLNGNNIDADDMTGLGFETSVHINGGLVEHIDDLYYRAQGAHRWYSDETADLGLNASMVLNRDGHLGIGIQDPEAPLHVDGGIRTTGGSLQFYNNSDNLHTGLIPFGNATFLRAYLGNLYIGAGASSTMVLNASTQNVGIGTALPNVKLTVTGGTDASPTNGNGFLQLGSENGQNVVLDNNEIMARDQNQAADLFIQRDAGNLLLCGFENGAVGIGVDDASNIPSSYLLAVDGRIISEEVRVEISAAWPDYVFEKDYPLLSISEFEKSIEENGHLPGIPSANEIESDGHHLGEIQRKLLEKIEELSLYIIQQEKRINALENKID